MTLVAVIFILVELVLAVEVGILLWLVMWADRIEIRRVEDEYGERTEEARIS